MNLLHAIERKETLKSLITKAIRVENEYDVYDIKTVSDTYSRTEKLIDEFVSLDIKIKKAFREILITDKDTISDALTHLEGLDIKIKFISNTITKVISSELKQEEDSKIDLDHLIVMKENLSKVRKELHQKILDSCLEFTLL